jgi:hypothetical protein
MKVQPHNRKYWMIDPTQRRMKDNRTLNRILSSRKIASISMRSNSKKKSDKTQQRIQMPKFSGNP